MILNNESYVMTMEEGIIELSQLVISKEEKDKEIRNKKWHVWDGSDFVEVKISATKKRSEIYRVFLKNGCELMLPKQSRLVLADGKKYFVENLVDKKELFATGYHLPNDSQTNGTLQISQLNWLGFELNAHANINGNKMVVSEQNPYDFLMLFHLGVSGKYYRNRRLIELGKKSYKRLKYLYDLFPVFEMKHRYDFGNITVDKGDSLPDLVGKNYIESCKKTDRYNRLVQIDGTSRIWCDGAIVE